MWTNVHTRKEIPATTFAEGSLNKTFSLIDRHTAKLKKRYHILRRVSWKYEIVAKSEDVNPNDPGRNGLGETEKD
jgi:hypothetical protein